MLQVLLAERIKVAARELPEWKWRYRCLEHMA
jgi:hypothetical protein